LAASFHGVLTPYIVPVYEPSQVGGITTGTDIKALIERLTVFSTPFGHAMSEFAGHMLFPDEERSGRFHFNVDPVEITSALDAAGFSGQFVMVVAATYGSRDHKVRRGTAKVFQVFKRSGAINLAGEDVLQPSLGMASHPLYPGKAT
jgi:hypothetical protein